MNVGAVPAGGPVRNTNYPVYSDALLNWYRDMGMTSVRLMFTWEAVQSTLGGPVPAPGAELRHLLVRPHERGHPAARARDGRHARALAVQPGLRNHRHRLPGQAITAAGFADFWGKFASAVTTATANDQRVAFDLINEPHTDQESGLAGDLGISLDDWFTCAQAAITSIRAAGVTNTVLVPGMTWTAASAFTTNGSAAKWTSLNDPQKNLGVTVHCYSGVEGAGVGSPTVLRDACAALVQWARPRGAKVHIGEIAIDAGDNGRPPFGSTLPLAQAQWADWQQFCLANDDVIVGWNWWGNSAPGWWDQGDSKNGHHWGLTLTDGATHTVATLGAPAEHFYVTTPRAPSLMARRPVPMSGVGHRP